MKSILTRKHVEDMEDVVLRGAVLHNLVNDQASRQLCYKSAIYNCLYCLEHGLDCRLYFGTPFSSKDVVHCWVEVDSKQFETNCRPEAGAENCKVLGVLFVHEFWSRDRFATNLFTYIEKNFTIKESMTVIFNSLEQMKPWYNKALNCYYISANVVLNFELNKLINLACHNLTATKGYFDKLSARNVECRDLSAYDVNCRRLEGFKIVCYNCIVRNQIICYQSLLSVTKVSCWSITAPKVSASYIEYATADVDDMVADKELKIA